MGKLKLDVPLVEGEELVFEPCAVMFHKHALIAVVTLNADGRVLVPVENYEALTVRMESDVVLGQVVRPSKAVDPVSDSKQVGQSLQIEAKTGSLVNDPKRQLIEVLGLRPNVGDLTAEQFEQLKQLLEENYDVFSLAEGELGCTNIVQHVIEMGDHPPIKQPIRRMPFVHREKISAMVDEMLAQGVIQPSVSAWSSPMVLVPIKDGTSRFCVDYRG